MDILSLIFGVIVGCTSCFIGILIKIKLGDFFYILWDLIKKRKEIFTVNPKLPNTMDFEVLESVTKKSDENITPVSNTDKPKNNEPSKEVKDKV